MDFDIGNNHTLWINDRADCDMPMAEITGPDMTATLWTNGVGLGGDHGPMSILYEWLKRHFGVVGGHYLARRAFFKTAGCAEVFQMRAGFLMAAAPSGAAAHEVAIINLIASGKLAHLFHEETGQ